MHLAPVLHRLATLGIMLAIGATSACAVSRNECEQQFSPRSGQSGKDVIWVPTNEELVIGMLEAAETTREDFVVDLGSGDGRIPIAAAKQFGARAMGIEYNPQMVELAQCYVRAEGVQDKVRIVQADIFETDFSHATVLTLYLLSDLNMKLRPKILRMKPGTRVVSNSFRMGDWNPDREIEVDNSYARAYLWIVPADVEGTWTFREEGGSDSFHVDVRQQYQQIEAAAARSGGASVRDARLRGADIEFTLVGHADQPLTLQGKVQEGRIHASTLRDGKRVTYTGTRS